MKDVFFISKELVACIVNNDPSGLSDLEESQVDAFCTKHKVFSLAILIENHDNMRKCAITGLMSDCYFVQVLH